MEVPDGETLRKRQEAIKAAVRDAERDETPGAGMDIGQKAQQVAVRGDERGSVDVYKRQG